MNEQDKLGKTVRDLGLTSIDVVISGKMVASLGKFDEQGSQVIFTVLKDGYHFSTLPYTTMILDVLTNAIKMALKDQANDRNRQ